jgi:hypothetical protein
VITVENKRPGPYQLSVMTTVGLPITSHEGHGTTHVNLSQQPVGIYIIQIQQNGTRHVKKISKN